MFKGGGGVNDQLTINIRNVDLEIEYSDNQKTLEQEDDFQNQFITLKRLMSMRHSKYAV